MSLFSSRFSYVPFKGTSSGAPQNNASTNRSRETTSKAIDRMLSQFLKTSKTSDASSTHPSTWSPETVETHKEKIYTAVREFLNKKVADTHVAKTAVVAAQRLVDLLNTKTYLPSSIEFFFKETAIAEATKCLDDAHKSTSVDIGRMYPHQAGDQLPYTQNPLKKLPPLDPSKLSTWRNITFDPRGLEKLDRALAEHTGTDHEKESALKTLVSLQRIDTKPLENLLKLKTLVGQFKASLTDLDKIRALRGIVDLECVDQQTISKLFPDVPKIGDLIDLTKRITNLVDHEILKPVSRDHITSNLHAVDRCMGSGWADRPADVQKLVPLVMDYYNDQIKKAGDAHREVDILTQRKFACAASFIQLTKGEDGEPWSTYLPKPAQFGLVRGYEVRDRLVSGGKSRPVVTTDDGRLVANNRKTLGKGTFGKVKTATTATDEYALKRISLHDEKLKNVDYEIFLDMAKEAHYAQTFSRESTNMLNVQDFWVYDDGKHEAASGGSRPTGNVSKFAMKMEVAKCDGLGVAGSKTLSISDKLNYMLDLAKGLEAMHRAGYAHNDFKLGNSVQGSDGVGKVVDFGFVAPLHVESSLIFSLWKVGGTFPSPEALQIRKLTKHVNTLDFASVDVYAFGTALAQMTLCALNNTDPKLSHTVQPIKVAAALRKGSQPPENKALGNLIWECVDGNPKNRPKMADVVTRLQDISRQYLL